MKVVCDDRIPYIREALASLTDDVVYIPGSAITAADVQYADALVVRTRTRCDRRLLGHSSVQIVVTATIGTDHLDTSWLDAAGIRWCNCPGCNATSVAQWVSTSLLALARAKSLDLGRMTLGIVGYGHVGHAVHAAMSRHVGHIVVNDPPLAERGVALPCQTAGLHDMQADIVTFHTPLTHDGLHPTHHLADSRFFAALTRPTVIINAARGGVIDEQALIRALDDGRVSAALIDTWEGEPLIDRHLLSRTFIGTPHIAGYSADGKANASRMAVEALARHFGVTPDLTSIVPPPCDTPYDPRRDSDALHAAPQLFESLRNNYPLRRE